VEGHNIILEFRFAGGDFTQGRRLAEELVAAPVDVIVSEGLTPDAAAATDRIPIVKPNAIRVAGPECHRLHLDERRAPWQTGAAAAHSVSADHDDCSPGQPLRPVPRTYSLKQIEQVETATRPMGLGNVRWVEADTAAALRALRPAVFSGASGVVVVAQGLFYNFRRDVVELVKEANLPAIYPEREYADGGGLMAYGANVPDNFRRAADYVDRILKGAMPGDLPIQEPVKFDFVVNLNTARALSLTIPPILLASATEVIE
jgi:putative ABC transport system substrate-binding protein